MKRFNFGTFLVDDSNRRAFQICQDIAELKPVSPCPVVLLGDEGCGKTHLLYSIVNRIRAGTTKTGLAYVTAVDFPDQVRHLIDDPSPVQRAQTAVLLVDQLDRFKDLIDELEAVVRIFLDHKHYVVLASKVHPGRLPHLSQGFRDLIDAGQIVQIVPRGAESQIETIRRQVRDEADAQLAKKQQEVEELRTLLNRVGKETSPEAPANVAALRAELEAERIAKADIGRKLAEAREAAQSAQEELEQYRSAEQSATERSGALRAELDRLRSDAARVQELERLADALREEADQARIEAAENLDTARDLHEQLEITRAEAARHVIATGEAQELIDKANADAASARERVDALVSELGLIRATLLAERESAHLLKAQLEQAQAETADTKSRFELLRGEFEQNSVLSDARGSEFESLRTELEAAREQASAAQQLRNQLQQLQAEMESIRGEAAASREEVESLHAQLTSATEESDRLRAELEAVQSQFAAASNETGRLRFEIESLQAVMKNSDHLQRELADVQNALDDARNDAQTHQRERDELEAQVVSLNAQLEEARGNTESLVARLESVLQQVETHRARSIEQSAAYRKQIEELERLLQEHTRNAVDPNMLATVKAQADEAVTQIDTLRGEFERERETLAGASERMRADYEAQLAGLQQELESTRREAEAVDAERETYRVELEKLKREHETTRSQIDELISARESAASSFLDAERDREQLRATLAQAQEQRHKFQTEAAKLRAERDAVKGKFEQAERALEERAGEIDGLKRSAATAQSLVGELEGRIARLETEREQLKQTARNLQQQMETVASNLMQNSQAFFAALGNQAATHSEGDTGKQVRPALPARRADTGGESWGPGGVTAIRPLDELAPLEEDGSNRGI